MWLTYEAFSVSLMLWRRVVAPDLTKDEVVLKVFEVPNFALARACKFKYTYNHIIK